MLTYWPGWLLPLHCLVTWAPLLGGPCPHGPGLNPGTKNRNSPRAQGHFPGGRGHERPMELQTPTSPRRGRSWDRCPQPQWA